jgi:hypothetical protein
VPVDSKGAKRWGFRNIKVVRDNVPSTPRINNILSGGNKMLSATERADVNAAKSNIQKENNPKGTITITKLRRAIDAMHEITGLSKYLEFKFGIECRRNALIYRVIDDTDDTEKKYVADRVKSSGVSDGRANFNIPVGKVLQRLLDGQSQTFIAMDNRRKTVRAIWFLYGEDACEMLKKFDKNLIIQLGITPKNKSKNLFSNAFNSEKYRYNISEPAERERLLNAKIEFASVNNVNANRETEEFWNSDKSQMCASHFKEQLIVNAMNEKLREYGVFAKKHVDDNSTKVDVRVILPEGPYSRVQSKMVTIRKDGTDFFNMCPPGRVPINLMVEIDSFDVYYTTTNGVFSLPARVINPTTGEIEPYLSKEEMSVENVCVSKPWRGKHMKYLCDLNDDAGVRKYIAFQKERVLNRPSCDVVGM